MHFKGLFTRVVSVFAAVTLLPVTAPAEAEAFSAESAQFEALTEDVIRTEHTVSRSYNAAKIAAVDDGVHDEDLQYQSIPLGRLRVGNLTPGTETDLDYTDMFYNRWEDCHYICLPATADRSHLTLTLTPAEGTSAAEVTLSGTRVISGRETDLLASADSFQMTVNGAECGELRIMQSNLGAIYLKTSHGGINHLNTYYNTVETGTVLMLDETGAVQYSGDLGELTRHGNSSWDYSVKKPYNLKLPEKQKLYGMGKAKKWVLLGNNLDHSMLRNAITSELCSMIDLYAPEYTFVDLYADGDYLGTYQLYEKVQIQKKRINIRDLEEETEKLNSKPLKEYPRVHGGTSEKLTYELGSTRYYDIPNDPEDITGGYLMQFQTWNRYMDSINKVTSGFVTMRGQAVQLNSPDYASKAQVEYISKFTQELEDALFSETGYNSLGRHYSEYVDVDSLIKGYLIQEFTMNPDGQQTSFYFWKESDLYGDGKLHYGPAWDFDLAYSNFSRTYQDEKGTMNEAGTKVLTYNCTNPNVLFILHQPISGYGEERHGQEGVSRIGWMNRLCTLESERIAEIYLGTFAPAIETLFSGEEAGGSGLRLLADTIAESAEMNNARWHMVGRYMYTPREILNKFGSMDGETFDECVEFLRSFGERRGTFLNRTFGNVLKDAMQEELKALRAGYTAERYDEEGIHELDALLTEASELCTLYETPLTLSDLYDATAKKLEAVPHKELPGDFDDDLLVTAADARAVLRLYANALVGYTETPNRTAQRNGDVNKDGKLDAADAMHILRAAVAAQTGTAYTIPTLS